MSPQIDLPLKEIYPQLCSECQEKIKDYAKKRIREVQDKLADKAIEDLLEDKSQDVT